MKKTFNRELNLDVMELKSTSKDSIGYREKFTGLLRKHCISRTTLYKELAKETPGEYMPGDYSGRSVPLSAGETEKVRELIFKGKQSREICLIMTAELGFSYTTRRLGSAKTRIITETDPKSASGIDTLRARENVRKFIYRLSGLDVTDPQKLYTLKLGTLEYKVPAGIIKESLDLLAISASASTLNAGTDSAGDGARAKDLNEIAKLELKREVLSCIRSLSLRNQHVPTVDLFRLDRIRKRLLEKKQDSAAGTATNASAGAFTPEDVLKAVLYFSPWTKRSEIERYLKKMGPGAA
jgi:hypothetical protein